MLDCKDVFPKILFSLGPLEIHFYGVVIAFSILFAAWVINKIVVNDLVKIKSKITADDLFDIAFWVLLGGVFGARFFYVIFYNWDFFAANPLAVLAIWKGGLSIHGGLTGGALALWLSIKKKGIAFWEIADLIVPFLALGLAFGRIANFVNGELVGRPTDFVWGCDFGDGVNRWPVQLIASLKNFFIFFATLFVLLRFHFPKGIVAGLFLMLIGCLRFATEFLREPDPQLGFIFSWLTMGQIFAIFTALTGLMIILYFRKKTN